MRISILGSGAWGTALAVTCASRHAVRLASRDAAHSEQLASQRENHRYLPGIRLPDELNCVAGFAAAARGADLVVLATPVAGLRDACLSIRDDVPQAVVWLCKGIEEDSHALPHAIVEATLSGVPAAVLSGPSFAREVAMGLPTALTAASREASLARRCVEAFHAQALRVYTSDDVTGVEVGGAVKNVLAIATGISDGLALGDNARAALMTRGLSEMMRLGVALGGRVETLMGLTGMGDLILTCTGVQSRNRRVGLALGAGRELAGVLDELGHVAEGVRCARGVRELARAHGIEMPIVEAVCAVVFEGVAPRQAVSALLARAARAER